ncbi:MAG: 4-hydroxy-3-methylbut-2-enyl diphosphate reductase [Chloroflexota bacterium]|nr:4-hydroxy-3-methylbut-2-enyl diphosphate reductase [Chloroflexota bacterium]|tara:strand:- start:12727 stop:13671 length:945 start_codon:yes stop_codon:yes gene_type:complete
MIKEIILAEPRGFCAGVIRAIEAVEEALKIYGAPIYVRKQIVHNPFVVKELEQKGAIFVEEVTEVPEGARVIFSAHGIAPTVKDMATQRSLDFIDATCPLVTKVHIEAVKYASRGNTIILIGHEGHDEVIGTMGEAPENMVLVGTVEEARNIHIPDPNKVAVISQTTLSVDDTKGILEVLKGRFPSMITPATSDICFATQNRQDAVKLLAKEVDLILVLGAENSSNSQRLREVASIIGTPSYLITNISELKIEWLDDITRIGITSGASTPEKLVDEVVLFFEENYGPKFRSLKAVEEDIEFSLPPEIVEIKKNM